MELSQDLCTCCSYMESPFEAAELPVALCIQTLFLCSSDSLLLSAVCHTALFYVLRSFNIFWNYLPVCHIFTCHHSVLIRMQVPWKQTFCFVHCCMLQALRSKVFSNDYGRTECDVSEIFLAGHLNSHLWFGHHISSNVLIFFQGHQSYVRG